MREAEGNYHPMVTASDVIGAVQGKLSRQMSILLEAAQIDACDEDLVKPEKRGFIRKYHHFTYPEPGVVACQYVKGVGAYMTHKMCKVAGMLNAILFSFFFFFFFCSSLMKRVILVLTFSLESPAKETLWRMWQSL